VDLPLDRPSGELYELEEKIRRMVASVRSAIPFVSGEEARKAVLVSLAAEAPRAWATRCRWLSTESPTAMVRGSKGLTHAKLPSRLPTT
jgi:hypothetical protein